MTPCPTLEQFRAGSWQAQKQYVRWLNGKERPPRRSAMEEEEFEPMPPYGERIPHCGDINACAALVEAYERSAVGGSAMRKLFDRVGLIFEVYAEQFRRPENG